MRTFDATSLNEVANLPWVRPLLGGEGDIDLTEALLNPNNYAFENPCGGFVVIRVAGTRYECHSMFKPNNDSRDIVSLMFAAQEFMFVQTDCDEIVTKIPEGNMAAVGLARTGKFVELFRRGAVWGPDKKAVSYLSLPLDRWARMCSNTHGAGEQFHDVIEAAKKAKGSALPSHSHDSIHSHVVGAAMLMAKAGNVVKGINFYNKWAAFAGYDPVVLLSEQPAVVDVSDAVIGLGPEGLEVLLCR